MPLRAVLGCPWPCPVLQRMWSVKKKAGTTLWDFSCPLKTGTHGQWDVKGTVLPHLIRNKFLSIIIVATTEKYNPVSVTETKHSENSVERASFDKSFG